MSTKKCEILEYLSESGKSPFQSWLDSLMDVKGRACIRQKINRLRLGYLSNIRALGDNVFEIRIFFGPGYRVYFGKSGKNTIILLYGGNKGSQKRDIERVKKYWETYQGR